MFTHNICILSRAPAPISHLGGEVSLRLELLEEGRQEEGGEEEDDGPEEDVWDVGAVVTAGGAQVLPLQLLTHLEEEEEEEEQV